MAEIFKHIQKKRSQYNALPCSYQLVSRSPLTHSPWNASTLSSLPTPPPPLESSERTLHCGNYKPLGFFFSFKYKSKCATFLFEILLTKNKIQTLYMIRKALVTHALGPSPAHLQPLSSSLLHSATGVSRPSQPRPSSIRHPQAYSLTSFTPSLNCLLLQELFPDAR